MTVNRPQHGIREIWVQDDNDEDDDEFDIIDLSQEVDNNGVGFVEAGRISNFHCSVQSMLC